MLILVTGACGYIGPVVARHLRTVHPDAKIRGLDNGFFLAQQDDGALSPETYFDEIYLKDVRDITVEDFQGIDVVVHLAAISNDPMGDQYAQVTYEINRDQTVRVAQLAKSAGVSEFVFASSGSVYGAGGTEAKSETSVLAPQTAYARSKTESETLLQTLASDDFRVTAMRFSTACGWSPRIRLDLVLNDFVASALTTGEITVLSDGTPWRPLIHVTDMARAIEWAVFERKNSVRSPYFVVNVGNDSWNFQVRDLAEAVAAEIPGIKVSINSAAPADKRSYKVDFGLWAAVAPNHQSERRIGETIQELSERLKSIDLTDDFRNSSRIRLKALNALQSRGVLSEDLRWSFKG